MDDDFTYVATWQGFVYVAFVVDDEPFVRHWFKHNGECPSHRWVA